MATSKGTKTASSSKPTKKASSSSSTKEKEQQKQKPKAARSAIGAPSQLKQSSRKGKKAWRKHVDIGDVEQTLEEMRAEERVTGTTIGKMKDTDLFEIDTKGDDNIRKSLPRFSTSQLTSTKILAQRSAVPAVLSRTTASAGKRKAGLSRDERERLMRIAKKPRKGPFNSVLDPAEYAPGSGVVEVSQAVKQSGTYDPWAEEGGKEEEEIKDGLETVVKKPVKAPATSRTRDLIEVPAIVEPHLGTSYNPPVDAHQELLEKAAAIEEKRLKDAEKLVELKAKMDNARLTQEETDALVAAGMTVQELEDAEDANEGEDEDGQQQSSVRKVPERKTKAQRRKAARVLAEKRLLAEKAAQKQLLSSINNIKSLRKSTLQQLTARQEERERKRRALAEKLRKHGLAGQKLGKHKVPEGRIEVQLGEDLSESLRGLKPEGSLFRDRFQSLQQRALIEPRAPVLPRKRKHKMVEYEKPAWKRFE